jgi:hypothetical protein
MNIENAPSLRDQDMQCRRETTFIKIPLPRMPKMCTILAKQRDEGQQDEGQRDEYIMSCDNSAADVAAF